MLNTLFLVREIPRNEQYDAFSNAVTHELKTPIASIRLSRNFANARRRTLLKPGQLTFYVDQTDGIASPSRRCPSLVNRSCRASPFGMRAVSVTQHDLRRISSFVVALA
jgi:hypothetical protein